MDVNRIAPEALRLKQQSEKAARMDYPVAGRFVTLPERTQAVGLARQAGVEASFDGGWPGAERMQVCFHPWGEDPLYTHQWVCAGWNSKFSHCEHRQLLGSLMALGIDRSFFGDLIVQEDCAYLCTLPEVASRLPMEWTQAGPVPLKVSLLDQPPTLEAPQGRLQRGTVASLRLDCILSEGMNLSRGKAAEMIRMRKVEIDHQETARVDAIIQENQTISVHGFGRVILREVGNPNRKDRLPVLIEIFQSRH